MLAGLQSSLLSRPFVNANNEEPNAIACVIMLAEAAKAMCIR